MLRCSKPYVGKASLQYFVNFAQILCDMHQKQPMLGGNLCVSRIFPIGQPKQMLQFPGRLSQPYLDPVLTDKVLNAAVEELELTGGCGFILPLNRKSARYQ